MPMVWGNFGGVRRYLELSAARSAPNSCLPVAARLRHFQTVYLVVPRLTHHVVPRLTPDRSYHEKCRPKRDYVIIQDGTVTDHLKLTDASLIITCFLSRNYNHKIER